MKSIYVYDIETLSNFHCATFMKLDNKEIRQFVIHKSRNDFTEYIKFLQTQVSGLIGFNNLDYDYPILHDLLKEQYLYQDILSYKYISEGEERLAEDIITDFIYNKSNEIINSEWSSIPEWKTLIPQLDLYKINHFDNNSKRTSLKTLEITMDFHNVEDLPFQPDHIVQDNEVEKILLYNLNDVEATYEFYKLNINDIEMRKALSKEFGVKLINANEPKIGSEIFAKLLSEEMNIPIKYLKQLRTYRESINLNECILPYIDFSTDEFKNLLINYKSKIVIETKNSIEESIVYKNFKYDFGLGGLHGCIKPGVYKINKNEVIHDIDVSSFYPNIAIINNFKPNHLGESFTTIYNKIYQERKSAPKGSAKNGGLKLAINGVFGKSNDKNSFLYDPMFTMQITVNGQLLLAMLAEKLVENIECTLLQINTDGITLKYNKIYSEKVLNIMKWWENLTKLSLESSYYKLMVIRDVNNYLALDINNKIKYKGAFEIIPMANGKKVYWKNISMRIVPIALEKYFINNIPIEETILNHTNIYHFCKRVKLVKGWWLEERWIEYDTNENKSNKLSKNVRYYVSTNGKSFIKCHEDGREISVEKGWVNTSFNRYKELSISEYNINYDYYINECNKIIKKITK